jgi:WD40 repeat protein
VVAARAEQAAGWRAGGRVTVEELVTRFPAVAESPDDLLVLICGEVEFRVERGEAADPGEYCRRFPALADRLPDQLAVLAALAAVGSTDPAGTTQPFGGETPLPPSPPGFEIVRVIGRGGMGEVYEALQTTLNRAVALKVVRGGSWADDAARARFRIEAQTLAAIRHPNVVQVHDSGEYDGGPYLAMERLPGGTLADRLGAGRLDPAAAAKLMAKVAAGVAAAHAAGIVHRDLKPGNVLFDEAGEPKVADFGLARRVSSDLTRSGALLGTPAYMAPEQATGNSERVGPAADVWALGVILYECLTGVRAFPGSDAHAVLAAIPLDDPTPPRAVVRGLPRDLDVICRKCLEKNPADRYPAADSLAADLNRFLAGEPIAARPSGLAERLLRRARRKPAATAAYGFSALAVSLAVVVFVVGGLWREAESSKGAAEAARVGEEKHRRTVQGLLDTETNLRDELEKALTGERVALMKANQAKQAAEVDRDHLDKEWRNLARAEYGQSARLAHQECQNNNISAARALLARAEPDRRGWEWRYVHRLCNAEWLVYKGHKAAVSPPAVSPNGKWVATGSTDGWVHVWEAMSGKPVATWKGHQGYSSPSFSPDGIRLVTASPVDRTARIWDAATGKQLGNDLAHVMGVDEAVFSPSGSKVISTCDDHVARVWDVKSGTVERELRGHTGGVVHVRFSPDGSRVVTTSYDGSARVWDTSTGDQKHELRLGLENDMPYSITYSEDGTRIITGSRRGRVHFFDAQTGGRELVPAVHADCVGTVGLSPNGRYLLTGGWDYVTRVWDTRTWDLRCTLRGHEDSGLGAAFIDDRWVVTTANDRTARVWDLDHQEREGRLWDRTDLGGPVRFNAQTAAFAPDGKRLALARPSGTVDLVPVQNEGGSVVSLIGHKSVTRDGFTSARVHRITFARDGSFLVTGGQDGTARVWDANTGEPRQLLTWHDKPVRWVAVDPDGRLVATASEDGTVRIGRSVSGEHLHELRGSGGQMGAVAFDPAGGRVVTAEGEGTARIWDAATGQPVRTLLGHKGPVWAASFSPDGKRVVTAGEDGTACIWDATEGKLEQTLRGHLGVVFVAAFSPDGSRVVTGGADYSVRLWDATSGVPLLVLRDHEHFVETVEFSPDGVRLLTSEVFYGKTRVWDSRPIPKYQGE